MNIFNLIRAHLVGCGFHTVGSYQEDQGIDNWLRFKGIENSPWQKKYLYSIYYSLITMCTVGYGDISPQSDLEIIYVLFITIYCCGMFAYAINTIGQIFQDLAKKKYDQNHQRYQVTVYMRHRQVDRNLQTRVLKYLEYLKEIEKEDPTKGIMILNKVSADVREQVKREYFGKLLKKIDLFSQTFSEKCLEAISLLFKEKIYGPGDVLYKKNEFDNRLMYIVKGETEIFVDTKNNDNKILTRLKKGQCFGQIGFFTNLPRDTAARSRHISIYAYIDQQDFLQVIQQYPHDYEKFCVMKDELMIGTKKGQQTIQCFSCQNIGHSVLNCQLLHLQINKSTYLMISNARFFQKQDKSLKRSDLKFKAYKIRQKVNKDLRKIRELFIAIALDEDPPSDFEDDIEDENDKEFYRRCDKIEYEQGVFRVIEFYSDSDYFSDSESDYLEEETLNSSISSRLQSPKRGSKLVNIPNSTLNQSLDDNNSTPQSPFGSQFPKNQTNNQNNQAQRIKEDILEVEEDSNSELGESNIQSSHSYHQEKEFTRIEELDEEYSLEKSNCIKDKQSINKFPIKSDLTALTDKSKKPKKDKFNLSIENPKFINSYSPKNQNDVQSKESIQKGIKFLKQQISPTKQKQDDEDSISFSDSIQQESSLNVGSPDKFKVKKNSVSLSQKAKKIKTSRSRISSQQNIDNSISGLSSLLDINEEKNNINKQQQSQKPVIQIYPSISEKQISENQQNNNQQQFNIKLIKSSNNITNQNEQQEEGQLFNVLQNSKTNENQQQSIEQMQQQIEMTEEELMLQNFQKRSSQIKLKLKNQQLFNSNIRKRDNNKSLLTNSNSSDVMEKQFLDPSPSGQTPGKSPMKKSHLKKQNNNAYIPLKNIQDQGNTPKNLQKSLKSNTNKEDTKKWLAMGSSRQQAMNMMSSSMVPKQKREFSFGQKNSLFNRRNSNAKHFMGESRQRRMSKQINMQQNMMGMSVYRPQMMQEHQQLQFMMGQKQKMQQQQQYQQKLNMESNKKQSFIDNRKQTQQFLNPMEFVNPYNIIPQAILPKIKIDGEPDLIIKESKYDMETIPQFDQIKEFLFYYPHNNYIKVLKDFKKLQKQRIQQEKLKQLRQQAENKKDFSKDKKHSVHVSKVNSPNSRRLSNISNRRQSIISESNHNGFSSKINQLSNQSQISQASNKK